jgi:hypothetical protein
MIIIKNGCEEQPKNINEVYGNTSFPVTWTNEDYDQFLLDQGGEYGRWIKPEPEKKKPTYTVTAFQFRVVMIKRGLMSNIESWIANQTEIIKQAFEYTTSFYSDSDIIKYVASYFGFSDEFVEELFIEMSKIDIDSKDTYFE